MYIHVYIAVYIHMYIAVYIHMYIAVYKDVYIDVLLFNYFINTCYQCLLSMPVINACYQSLLSVPGKLYSLNKTDITSLLTCRGGTSANTRTNIT